MIRLVDVDEGNWLDVRALSVGDGQKGFLDSAVGIIARGYVYRSCRARVMGIEADGTIVGVALVRDLDEEPACYDLQQLMIDARHQGRGIGSQALRLIIAELAAEQKYDHVEVCVNRDDAAALHVYGKVGFVDTGYVDEDVPDCLNLVLSLA
ncbi:MAG: GNAT family N-acetyltransferase [Aeriscardovia sp.]|nr:GNAT family N-acetyltransferase [Aeriscardovia sp.]